MKKFYLFLSLFLIINTNQLQAQNDSIYFWKTGVLLEKRSIKTADLDSITFKRPNSTVIIVPGSNVIDIDGNIYQSVTNCNQSWTTSNLNVSKYSDGTPIPQVTNPTLWGSLTTGAWCYYYNDPASESVYGKLYNWYAVAGIYDAASLANPSLRKNLAPTGWHVPTNVEWTNLTSCLGGDSVAGGKMKETGTIHWRAPNIDATNNSGFTALPGGYRSPNGTFYNESISGLWWSSSEDNVSSAWGLSLNFDYGGSIIQTNEKNYIFAVRCIKD
jgi:uncharacterized protein (TIGR02145 family)